MGQDFQSLNRVQSLFNTQQPEYERLWIVDVSIAQSRPIPLQQGKRQDWETSRKSFNRSIASNPSSTRLIQPACRDR